MNISIGRRSRWLVGVAILLFSAATLQVTEARTENSAPLPATVLRGTIAHAPSKGVTLILNKARQAAVAGDDGSFSFPVQLQEPAYAELEFDFRKQDTLGVFLLPGQPLTLNCDASDIFGTAKFAGKAAAENAAFARLQIIYSRIDYGKLFQPSPEEFLSALRQHQEELKSSLAQSSSGTSLDASFLRFEGERIKYFGALLRVARLGLSADWKEYASHLDFNDPTLLPIDTYSRFLSSYTRAKSFERVASDPVLKTSSNQATEARYAVAIETYKDPAVRNSQLHAILLDQFVNGGDGPFGCKGIETLISRFDRDSTDAALREDIDKRYRECLANRNAPVIRPYKTIGTTSLDAHIFPVAGAGPGAKNPAYLFFHGAGWAAGMPEWGYGNCRRLAAKGIVGISFEYRLRWRHGTTPIESVADAKSAVRWTRQHAAELGIDPDRIVVAGFSAGGHLAAATALVQGYDEPGEDTSVSSVPNAMVLSSAAVDVADPGWFTECLAGRGDARALSPAQHVRSGLPPAIVFHGVKDELADFSKVEAFCNNMRAAGNRCELITFKGGHFREPADWPVEEARTDEFLQSLGFLKQR
jgi:acetyl esterase/lipase